MRRLETDERGEGEFIVVVLLAILGLAIYGGVTLFQWARGTEYDGTVKYEDCREIIQLKPADRWTMASKKFTCSIQRSVSGKVMAGECVHVETTSDGKCQKAFVYRKTPELACPESAPWLGYDEKCSAEYADGKIHAVPDTAK